MTTFFSLCRSKKQHAVIIYLHLLFRVHISIPRGLTFHVRKILQPLSPPNVSPPCSLYLSVLKMMFCQFNSHYSNIFINMYGKYWDRKEAEECEGGQRRLSTPTSLVMEIIQCNIWIAIFLQQMRMSRAERKWGGEGFNLPFAHIYQTKSFSKLLAVSIFFFFFNQETGCLTHQLKHYIYCWRAICPQTLFVISPTYSNHNSLQYIAVYAGFFLFVCIYCNFNLLCLFV